MMELLSLSSDTRRSESSESRRTSLDEDEVLEESGITPSLTRRLFISHFLSTWNSRVFEFGAVLFIARIIPGTLLFASLYALIRGGAAIVFAPAVGRYVDRYDRLRVVRLSIVGQRAVTAISCVGFLLLNLDTHIVRWVKVAILGALAMLACLEKLCSIMNLVAVERDWAVTIAGDDDAGLQVLNSQMRRIDLFCKLAGPLVISMIESFSTIVAIYIVLGLNLASVVVEYLAIAKVYVMVKSLQQPRSPVYEPPESPPRKISAQQQPLTRILDWARVLSEPVSKYIHHPIAMPSMALSILYFTVLSFSTQMITYLLSVGYNSRHVGLLRTVSVVFELSATWLAPLAMKRVRVVRAGLWFINWQLFWVCSAVGTFWLVRSPPLAAFSLIIGVILSRVGLWGFDLCVQLIVQEEVEPEHRGSFSSMEASFQNFFELLSFAATVVFSRPEEFRYPVLMSCVAVLVAAIFYADFVMKRRGHLIHMLRWMSRKENSLKNVIACEEARDILLT